MSFLKNCFLIFVLLSGMGLVFAYNESWSNITLAKNSNCFQNEILFTLYNEAEFLNDTENFTFTKISNANITVYSTNVDWMGILFSGFSDSNSQFRVKFPAKKEYLIEIRPPSGYNWYEEIMLIEDCEYIADLPKLVDEQYILRDEFGNETNLLENKTITNSSYEIQPPAEDNAFIEYSVEGASLELVASNHSLVKVNYAKLNSTDLELKNISIPSNFNLSFEVNLSNTSSNKIVLNLNFEENDTLEVFSYDGINSIWTKVDFEKGLNNVSFSVAENGLYAVSKYSPPKLSVGEEEVFEDVSPDKKGGNMVVAGVILGVFVLIILVVFLFLRKKPATEITPESVNASATTQTPSSNNQTVEKLNSYAQVYEKSKEYVRKYKASYSKDQIYRALQIANIPKDIIDKIFEEEY